MFRVDDAVRLTTSLEGIGEGSIGIINEVGAPYRHENNEYYVLKITFRFPNSVYRYAIVSSRFCINLGQAGADINYVNPEAANLRRRGQEVEAPVAQWTQAINTPIADQIRSEVWVHTVPPGELPADTFAGVDYGALESRVINDESTRYSMEYMNHINSAYSAVNTAESTWAAKPKKKASNEVELKVEKKNMKFNYKTKVIGI